MNMQNWLIFCRSSSLARIESSIMQAMEQQDKANRASREIEDEVDELTPLIHSKTVPAQTEDGDGLGLRGINRVFTGTTLSASITKVPQDSTPPLSEVDGSDMDTPKSCMPTNRLRKTSAPTTDRDHRLLPSSPRSSEDYTNGSIRSYHSRKDFLQSGESSADVNDLGAGEAHIVIQAVAEAMKELSKIKQREQSSRPPRLVPEDPDRRPNSMLSERFHQLADEELQIRRLNVKDWLRVATWWLLKVKSFTMTYIEMSDFSFRHVLPCEHLNVLILQALAPALVSV